MTQEWSNRETTSKNIPSGCRLCPVQVFYRWGCLVDDSLIILNSMSKKYEMRVNFTQSQMIKLLADYGFAAAKAKSYIFPQRDWCCSTSHFMTRRASLEMEGLFPRIVGTSTDCSATNPQKFSFSFLDRPSLGPRQSML